MKKEYDLKSLEKRPSKIKVDSKATKKTASAHRYYDLEVTLVGTRPRVWRRFLLREQATFHDLHDAIQIACGWENSHLYSFFATRGRTEIATSPIAREDVEGGIEKAPPDAHRVKISSYFDGESKSDDCKYVYDFGDNWEHRVVMHGLVERSAQFKRQLLDGARAFPPEDCGGMPRYEDCVSIKSGAKASEGLEDLAEWLGDWEPESFDLMKVSKRFNK